MKKLFFISIILLCAAGIKAQHIPAYTASDIVHRASAKDTVYIVNFWATWCVPCVQELPEFNALQKRYVGKAVKILMVSLDFKEDYPDKLSVFIKRKNLLPEVAWLSETDPNVFIPKIDNSWQGSIPATLVVAPGKKLKKFIEGMTTEDEVSKLVDKMISQQ